MSPRPTDQLTFAHWLRLEAQGAPDTARAELSVKWKPVRGRLSRERVERIAQLDLACCPGVGYAAYDQYKADTATTQTQE